MQLARESDLIILAIQRQGKDQRVGHTLLEVGDTMLLQGTWSALDKRLADRRFIAGEYSIADMTTYPWIVPYERQGQKLEDFPHLKRWFETIAARPAHDLHEVLPPDPVR